MISFPVLLADIVSSLARTLSPLLVIPGLSLLVPNDERDIFEPFSDKGSREKTFCCITRKASCEQNFASSGVYSTSFRRLIPCVDDLTFCPFLDFSSFLPCSFSRNSICHGVDTLLEAAFLAGKMSAWPFISYTPLWMGGYLRAFSWYKNSSCSFVYITFDLCIDEQLLFSQ